MPHICINCNKQYKPTYKNQILFLMPNTFTNDPYLCLPCLIKELQTDWSSQYKEVKKLSRIYDATKKQYLEEFKTFQNANTIFTALDYNKNMLQFTIEKVKKSKVAKTSKINKLNNPEKIANQMLAGLDEATRAAVLANFIKS